MLVFLPRDQRSGSRKAPAFLFPFRRSAFPVHGIPDRNVSRFIRKSDVTRAEDMQALVRLAKEKFGRVDVLFANAGIMPGGNMPELKVKDWTDMVNINVVGVLHAMAAVLPEFIAQKSGHIGNQSYRKR